jgi:peptide subunit release factor RF-3
LNKGYFNLTLEEKKIGSTFNFDMMGQELIKNVNTEVSELEVIHREIILQGPIGSKDQSDLFNSDSVPVKFGNNLQRFDIKEATEQLINYGFEISANPYS